MLDRWTDYLEYGGQIDVLYSDFEKTFDKVPHTRLLYLSFIHTVLITLLLTGYEILLRVEDINQSFICIRPMA